MALVAKDIPDFWRTSFMARQPGPEPTPIVPEILLTTNPRENLRTIARYYFPEEILGGCPPDRVNEFLSRIAKTQSLVVREWDKLARTNHQQPEIIRPLIDQEVKAYLSFKRRGLTGNPTVITAYQKSTQDYLTRFHSLLPVMTQTAVQLFKDELGVQFPQESRSGGGFWDNPRLAPYRPRQLRE